MVEEADALARSVEEYQIQLDVCDAELGLLAAIIKRAFEIDEDDIAIYYIATAFLLGYQKAMDDIKLEAGLPELGD